MIAMKVRLFISPGESFWTLTREAGRSESSRLSFQRACLTSDLEAGFFFYFPERVWAQIPAVGGAPGRRRRRWAAGILRREWERSSVREEWREVDRKRLIYTSVMTLVLSYPRGEEERRRRDGGGGEESDARGGKDGRFQLAGGQTARTGGWREEIKGS